MPCAISPDPKTICTGATLYSLAITSRKLQFYYKLYARCYGWKDDGDIQGRHSHTARQQKFVNLFEMMLAQFREKGYYVLCDSAYGRYYEVDCS